MTTAMLYLTSVSAGGRTIFPRLGLSIQPKAGNLVFWSTRLSRRGQGQGGWVTFFLHFFRRSDGTIDPRMDHQGCPVLYGNKWIANKWIRWTEQVFIS